jgi:hypothetical protein
MPIVCRFALVEADFNLKGVTMAYTAEISRNAPSCLFFLIDQSGSMGDPFAPGNSQKRKADGVADAINRLLQNLVIKCAKPEGIRNYYEIGALGYGSKLTLGFGGTLADRELVPLSEVGSAPSRLEERTKKVDDGAGGLIEQVAKFPVWFESLAHGGTPMCKALETTKSILEKWVATHRASFPPIVINISDGESRDGNPEKAAEELKALATDDGNLLLFNVYLSALGKPLEFPANESALTDVFSKQLFKMASELPSYMREVAQQEGYPVEFGSRGFVANADMISVIRFLDIGTRASNLR